MFSASAPSTASTLGAASKDDLRELFGRLVFNILCSNTDDHARNHAAFWNGESLSLTPAYDICPQARSGFEATQAMLITGDNRFSQIVTCLKAAPHFLLSADQAFAIVAHQVKTIIDTWLSVGVEAELTEVERNLLWRRQFLNPFAFDGAPAAVSILLRQAD